MLENNLLLLQNETDTNPTTCPVSYTEFESNQIRKLEVALQEIVNILAANEVKFGSLNQYQSVIRNFNEEIIPEVTKIQKQLLYVRGVRNDTDGVGEVGLLSMLAVTMMLTNSTMIFSTVESRLISKLFLYNESPDIQEKLGYISARNYPQSSEPSKYYEIKSLPVLSRCAWAKENSVYTRGIYLDNEAVQQAQKELNDKSAKTIYNLFNAGLTRWEICEYIVHTYLFTRYCFYSEYMVLFCSDGFSKYGYCIRRGERFLKQFFGVKQYTTSFNSVVLDFFFGSNSFFTMSKSKYNIASVNPPDNYLIPPYYLYEFRISSLARAMEGFKTHWRPYRWYDPTTWRHYYDYEGFSISSNAGIYLEPENFSTEILSIILEDDFKNGVEKLLLFDEFCDKLEEHLSSNNINTAVSHVKESLKNRYLKTTKVAILDSVTWMFNEGVVTTIDGKLLCAPQDVNLVTAAYKRVLTHKADTMRRELKSLATKYGVHNEHKVLESSKIKDWNAVKGFKKLNVTSWMGSPIGSLQQPQA